MKLFKKLIKFSVSFQNKATSFAMIILPFIVVVQVLLRYVFKAPLMGIEELLLFPTIWLYMLGGAVASEKREHISCGILSLYIRTEKGMQRFNVLKMFFSSIISLWVTYWAFWYFRYSLRMWKLSDLLYIPMFLAESALFIGFFVMSIYTVYYLVMDFRVMLGKDNQDFEEEN